ncbi:unnamed protein product [Mytilus edulis]|uniref:C-type lectin domain-containing protein n=1 Tax=Mytilus edulis TaxID=6550 RepID=A0A8S3Q4U2_MYTED|nr:unnamed protein product [Mytilus edulis]
METVIFLQFLLLTALKGVSLKTLRTNILKAVLVSDLNGFFEYSASLENTPALSLNECTMNCNNNDLCVSFFYNLDTGECVLHSNRFYSNEPPSGTGVYWKYFVATSATVTCPAEHTYYRQLKFCYSIHESDPIDFTQIKTFCSSRGGELAAVSSVEMNNYFKEFLAIRPHIRVCIAGEEQPDGSWELEDGTSMSYFNWYPGQPESGNQGCIVIKATSLGDMWMDASCAYSRSCVFVCEY